MQTAVFDVFCDQVELVLGGIVYDFEEGHDVGMVLKIFIKIKFTSFFKIAISFSTDS